MRYDCSDNKSEIISKKRELEQGSNVFSRMKSFSGFSLEFENNDKDIQKENGLDNICTVEKSAPRGQISRENLGDFFCGISDEKTAPLGQKDGANINALSVEHKRISDDGFDSGCLTDHCDLFFSEIKDIQDRMWSNSQSDVVDAELILDLLILTQRLNLVKKNVAELYRREINKNKLEQEELVLDFVSSKINPVNYSDVRDKSNLSDRFQFIDGSLRWRISLQDISKYCALQIAKNDVFLEYVSNMSYLERSIVEKFEKIRVSLMKITTHLKFLINVFFDSLDMKSHEEIFSQRVGHDADSKED